MEPKQLADQLGEVTEAFAKVKEQVTNLGADLMAKIEAGQAVSSDLKEKADKALMEIGGLSTRMTDLERRAAREREGDDAAPKSLGQLVVESEAFKKADLNGGSRGSVRIKVDRADITSANTTVGAGRSAGTSLAPGHRIPGIVAAPERRMTIRDLVMPGQTSAASVEYVQETGYTNNAGMVAEGTQKPKSDITFNLVTAPVRTIAHIFKASRQILDDAVGLQSYIDGRARYGLQLKEEQQLLLGDGTGQNIEGLIPQASAFAPAFGVADEQMIDQLRLAILQVYLAEYPASAIVLNPIDWGRIETLKDGEGRYLIANPQGSIQKMLWNLPVVDTQAMSADDFLVGAFDMAAQVFDRLEIEVLLSSENVDDFEKNMFTIRAEERLAFAVYRPEAFVTGSFGNEP